ncbi:hypothetical protein TNCT6_40890 [Streptomyces sp. 6-11-2]|nr:hypothetical protein TNCT6_40890 [Streptomyces sp. 6-11-2]
MVWPRGRSQESLKPSNAAEMPARPVKPKVFLKAKGSASGSPERSRATQDRKTAVPSAAARCQASTWLRGRADAPEKSAIPSMAEMSTPMPRSNGMNAAPDAGMGLPPLTFGKRTACPPHQVSATVQTTMNAKDRAL